ncbi:permease-like cell division protein FtsX [Actinoplanes subtropicus]|uniref:permease-like cell division protein FtsX n=1 Tax=Actinoplanes subtropicus TaxID=543632 RepID=UPI0004C2DA3C|nr:permease-like cell division protein FtsX [Actinoplanes subtropicus]
MERHLRDHFDRAVDDDPGVAPGYLARAAIVEGVRLRRRRNQRVATGLVLVIGVVAGLSLLPGHPATDRPAVASSCTVRPVEQDATDVAIFLKTGISDPQRVAILAGLSADPRVRSLVIAGHGTAYERFQQLWADDPHVVDLVTADHIAESFRVRLVAPAQYTAFRARYATMAGVDGVVGHRCPASAPVGGLQ